MRMCHVGFACMYMMLCDFIAIATCIDVGTVVNDVNGFRFFIL